MKIIIGLGNPGKKYEHTRHNAGFLAVDFLLENFKLSGRESKSGFYSQVWEYTGEGDKILLVKPQTFMNNSGQAAAELANFYKINPSQDLLVIHDDVDLPFHTWKLVPAASSAGHNGVQDIIDRLGTQDFYRIRIGVESRQNKNEPPTDSFVLSPFSPQELSALAGEVFKDIQTGVKKFLDL